MRFAWLRKNSANSNSVTRVHAYPLALIKTGYNVVFWVFLLPFFTAIEYGAGFIAFTVVILLRLSANLYLNNILKPEQAESFPFRS